MDRRWIYYYYYYCYRVSLSTRACLQHVSRIREHGAVRVGQPRLVCLFAVVRAVPCGAGTFYNIEGDHCSLCHPGSYQHLQAQLQCQSCPPGTATVQYGATDVQQCEGSMYSIT